MCFTEYTVKMHNFGTLDSSYKAAGEEAGIRKLVDEFYHQMETQKRGQHIRAMHKEDLDVIKDKRNYSASLRSQKVIF